MVNLNVLLILIMTLLAVICVCVVMVLSQVIGLRHKRHEADEERKLKYKQMILDYNIDMIKVTEEVKPKEVKDPEVPPAASENELSAWFELMADPDKLFDNVTQKKEE